VIESLIYVVRSRRFRLFKWRAQPWQGSVSIAPGRRSTRPAGI